ncbi:MAG: amino acid adenylation domain-containing protein, partial [Proteobacteria bacterium]|nr:amino acid adenylation domain-containing protein [Pseudomonadota bacterium]
TTFENHDTFKSVLRRIKETTLQAYQHQDVPFEQLVDHLNVPRALNSNPIFQSMLVFQNITAKEEALTLHNIEITSVFSSYPIAKFDLSILAHEYEEGIKVGFEYSTDLFNELTIKQFAQHFKELIKGILQNPNRLINELSLLTLPEQRQLLFEWNNTYSTFSENNKCIHHLFEEQVEKTPQNIALVYEDEQLTYQELNDRANQLAHYLRSKGVGPDTLVAIAVERSFDMIIGLLGILKAGGAYVPLDPSYPSERLSFILQDTKTSILITQSYLQEKLKQTFSTYLGETVIIDQCLENFQTQHFDNLTSLTFPHHLAYAIYTSGSLGKPKGVLGEHSAIINRFSWMWNIYPFSKNETAVCKTSLSFVDSIWEIFGPLLKGIKLLIVPKHKEKEATYLINVISKDTIKRCLLVPSLLKSILQSSQTEINKNNHKEKKLFIVSGEALNSSIINMFKQIFPNDQLLNLYGSSEVAADVTYHLINSEERICSLGIIGHPIANTEIYILDTYLNPVPVGVSGEIYIGGAGLARGYLNRPDLTAERFVPNPFLRAKDPQLPKHLRLYRTGDLARYLPDGNIEFLGR